jgi:cytochrome c-type biogenesis protein CcmE
MTPRRQRMVGVAVVLVGVGIATVLLLRALESNIMYFFSPEQIVAGEVQEGEPFRLGGLVKTGSFTREPGNLEARFIVTDNTASEVTVAYTGVLPDLFKEGQGMVANGELSADGVFIADEVLAKHDENYMSPDVAKMLEEQGHPAGQTDTLITEATEAPASAD